MSQKTGFASSSAIKALRSSTGEKKARISRAMRALFSRSNNNSDQHCNLKREELPDLFPSQSNYMKRATRSIHRDVVRPRLRPRAGPKAGLSPQGSRRRTWQAWANIWPLSYIRAWRSNSSSLFCLYIRYLREYD